MNKIVSLVLIVAIGVCAKEGSENVRQKRLLFFDEAGSLVRTYPNPYMNHLALNADLPYYGKFLNPFFSFIRAFGETIAAFTIPVSKAIIEQINKDPNFQQSLVIVPKNPVIAPNSVCAGKRTQIPSTMCNNFLNCWDGWAYEQECPKGLLFSNEGYCDYAGNVDCNNRKLDLEQLQPEPVCTKDFEAHRSKYNCNEFFVCVNRQPVKFNCPADLAYSQILGVCDYADRVDCKSSNTPLLPPISNPSPIASNPLIIPSIPSAPSTPEKDIPGITSPAIPVTNIKPIRPTTFPFIPTPIPPAANSDSMPSSAPIPSGSFPPAPVSSGSFPAAPMSSGSLPSAPISSGSFPSVPISSGSFPAAPMSSGSFPPAPMSSGSFSPAPMSSGSFPPAPIPSESFPPAPISSGSFPPKPISSGSFPSAPASDPMPTPAILSTSTSSTSNQQSQPSFSYPSSPELRPVPLPSNMFDESSPKPNDAKPALPLGTIFGPACSGHVAMSRDDAIRQLQLTHADY